MRPWLVALGLAMLASCASPAQIAARHDGICQSYGAVPGTPPYMDCRLRLSEMEQQASFERRRAVGQALVGAAACSHLPAGQAFACGATGYVPPSDPVMRCSSERNIFGGFDTTCR